MNKRLTAMIVAVSVGMTALFVPSVALALAADAVPGVLVDDVAHELPAPAVALASDGRALVVYQSADPALDPTDPDAVCDENGGQCVVLAVVVEADGVTMGEPFVVSGDAVFGDYYSAPQVVWNEELGEWLVLMTSYETTPASLFAQRVAADGTLAGSTVELPSQHLTTHDDRNTTIETAMSDHILPNATWSPALQAYLVTWVARGDSSSRYSAVGYFMNADLTSMDGVDAAFSIGDTSVTNNYSSRQAFNPATGEWAVAWSERNSKDVWLTGVGYDGAAITLSDALLVADGAAVPGMWPQGGLTWVDSQSAWLVSFGGTIGDSPTQTYEVFGRYVSGDLFGTPTVGESIPLTEHGLSRFGTLIDEGRSHEIVYDAASDTVYGAGTLYYPDENADDLFSAVTWSFDPATEVASDVVELFAPSGEVPADGVVEQSSRARISVVNDGVAVTWQNWLGGMYQDPTQVRYALLEDVAVEEVPTEEPAPGTETPAPPAALAATGAEGVSVLAGLTVLLLAAGMVLMIARRRVTA